MNKFYSVSRIISVLVFLTGVIVLCGWILEIENLKSFLPGYIPMRINTAFCFVLSGIALWLINNNPSPDKNRVEYGLVITLSAVIFLMGLLTQLQYIISVDLGIDLMIMGERSLANPGGLFPGRMSPIPSFNFVLAGLIFLLMTVKPEKYKIYRGLAFVMFLIALFTISVYIYHTASYIENPDFTSLALNTAVSFLLLSAGILLVQPDSGLIALLSGKGFAGVIAWQLFPYMVIIPLTMGIVWLEGKKTGWDISESGTMLYGLLFLIVLIALVIGNVVYILNVEKKFRIHEQSAYIASIVNFSDDAIISKSLDGIILSWNRGAQKVFGYTEKEVIGRHISLFIPDDRLSEEKTIIDKIKKGEVVEHYETIRKRKDGNLIHVSLTVSPLRDHTGTITGASKIARDITEKKITEVELQKRSLYVEERINEIVDVLLNFTQMDFSKKITITDKGDELDAIGVGINSLYEELASYVQQIKESNEQIETIFRHAPDAIVVINDEGMIEQWNPKAEIIFGWEAYEVIGKPLHELIIPQEYREAHRQGIKHFMKTGEASVLNRSLEMPALRKNGKLFDAELSISPSIIKGKYFFIGIINDITERRQAEETRKRYIEQLAQNKELESFAYIVSHDLKTPLQGIAKIADWLIKDYSDRLDDTGKQYLELLKNRMMRMEALINGILDYSRAGRADDEKTELDFKQLITEVVEVLSVPENVKFHILDEMPTLVLSKSAMTQVFGNLISNAIKHNDKPAAEIEIGGSKEEDGWKFYVKDNGPGIEKEHHEKIFKIFQTLKQADAKNNTGIGLGIVKKIVEKEGGKVWIESKTGQGSTFFFTIKG